MKTAAHRRLNRILHLQRIEINKRVGEARAEGKKFNPRKIIGAVMSKYANKR